MTKMFNYDGKNNLEIWDKYKAVPKNAMKPFDNGTFKGTDINTMWRMKSLTETFGPCGIGWYYELIRTWNEEKLVEADNKILTFAEIKLYVKVNGEWSQGICGVGGNAMLSFVKQKGDKPAYYRANDEVIKMAVTDALGNACRNLGIGADVYWENDKTKYTTDPETPPDTPESPTLAQINRLETLGGSIMMVAEYYKTEVDKVSAEMVQRLIDAKERQLKKAAEAAEGQNADK